MRIKHFLFSAFLFFLSACELQALPGIKLNCDPKTDASCGGEVTKTPPDDGGDGADDPPPPVDPVPPKVDLSCDRGALPPLNLDGFPGWLGLRKVAMVPGDTHTYCVNLNWDTSVFTMSVVDRTGASQCFYHIAEYIPPAGSGLAPEVTPWIRINTGATFASRPGSLLPKGTWKIRIKSSIDFSDCSMAYEVTAH